MLLLSSLLERLYRFRKRNPGRVLRSLLDRLQINVKRLGKRALRNSQVRVSTACRLVSFAEAVPISHHCDVYSCAADPDLDGLGLR